MPDSLFVELYTSLWARLFGLERYAMQPEIRKHNPWIYRKNQHWTADFSVGKHVSESGGETATPYRAHLQKISPRTLDLDERDPEHRMAIHLDRTMGEAPHEFSFENIQTGQGPEQNPHGITGTGHAHEMARKASGAFLHALHAYGPRMVYYTAEEPSRAKLYRHMTAAIPTHAPQYRGYQIEVPGDQRSFFAAVHQDHAENFEQQAQALGLSATNLTGTRERYTRKSSPGQMSLFGDHDVSHEPRDAHGEWTAGGPQKSEKPDVVPVDNRATLRQDETKPALEEKPMGTQFTVTLAREPSSDKQRQYINDVLAEAGAKLDELAKAAPLSVDVVRKRHQESLSRPKTNFPDNVIGQYRDKDWLSEVYQVAERELRNKEEKAALMPLRQAAADAFRAIPVRRFGQ